MDVCVTNTDIKSYRGSTSAKLLERAARKKRAKYEKACFEQRLSFMTLVYSVDRMAGKDARACKNGLLVSLQTNGAGSTALLLDGSRGEWLLPLCVLTLYY